MQTEQEVIAYAATFSADYTSKKGLTYAMRQDWIPVPTRFTALFQAECLKAFEARKAAKKARKA